MRPSTISGSGRAVSQLCSACRKEIIRSAVATSPRNFSSAPVGAVAAKTSRQTATVSATQKQATNPRRWLSHFRPLAHAAASPSATPTDQQQSSSQPPDPQQNKPPPFYALFPETLPDGPPPSGPFHIDLRSLKREFLRLQATSHPDFHHSGGSTQSDSELAARRQAEKTSALINTAYKTLSSPLLRAQYLLHELHGINLADDESGSQSGDGGTDPELLMTVLEAREVIEEAEREEDLEELWRL